MLSGVLSGMYILLGKGGKEILAAPAPGLVTWVGVRAHRWIAPNDVVRFLAGTGTVALDGEREIELSSASSVAVRLRADGPVVVDVRAALADAARAGHLQRE